VGSENCYIHYEILLFTLVALRYFRIDAGLHSFFHRLKPSGNDVYHLLWYLKTLHFPHYVFRVILRTGTDMFPKTSFNDLYEANKLQGIRSSGIWRYVTEYMVPVISRKRSGLVSKGRIAQVKPLKMRPTSCRHNRNQVRSDDESSYPRRRDTWSTPPGKAKTRIDT